MTSRSPCPGTFGWLGRSAASLPRNRRSLTRTASSKKAGTIPAGWRDDEGRGPEECERRLAAEDVELVDGKAHVGLRVYHEELSALIEASEASEDLGPGS